MLEENFPLCWALLSSSHKDESQNYLCLNVLRKSSCESLRSEGIGSVLLPSTSASCCSVCLATAKTQKSKSAAVGLEQSLLSPGATWGKMSVPPGRAALASTRPPRSVCAGPRGCSGGAVPVVSRPRLRRAVCRGAHLVATRSCDAPTSCCTVIPLEVWKIC